MSDATPRDSVLGAVLEELARRLISPQSERRLGDVIRGFGLWLERKGARFPATDTAVIRMFVESRTTFDAAPSVATMHLRRSAIRLCFRLARDLGLVEGDSTLDLILPPRSGLRLRPLAEDEVVLCRAAALVPLAATRVTAAWALAEATATTSEVGAVFGRDVDVANRRVWLVGASKRRARWGHLTEWGGRQVERRLRNLADSSDRPLVYDGTGSLESRQAAACALVSKVLVQAGLGGERDVRPGSVAAWAGAEVFTATGRIDEVARRLGLRSLDQAARIIAWSWQQPDG